MQIKILGRSLFFYGGGDASAREQLEEEVNKLLVAHPTANVEFLQSSGTDGTHLTAIVKY